MNEFPMDDDRAKRFTDGYFIIVDPTKGPVGRTDGQPLTEGDLDFIKNGPPSPEELARRWRAQRKSDSKAPS